jgi:hypothetical protein
MGAALTLDPDIDLADRRHRDRGLTGRISFMSTCPPGPVSRRLDGKTLRKVVYVPDKALDLVVG